MISRGVIIEMAYNRLIRANRGRLEDSVKIAKYVENVGKLRVQRIKLTKAADRYTKEAKEARDTRHSVLPGTLTVGSSCVCDCSANLIYRLDIDVSHRPSCTRKNRFITEISRFVNGYSCTPCSD